MISGPEDLNDLQEEEQVTFDDSVAIERLWDEFYPRLKMAVSSRVRSIQRPVADESAIALSAFNSFIQGAREGKFADLADQDEMWRLVKTIAIRKTNDSRKNLRAKKRGGEHVTIGQSDVADETGAARGIDAAASNQMDPSLDVEVADLFNTMMSRLPDDRHRDAILLKLQGASVATIAECLGTTTRTVQRLLKKIEEDWQSELME